MRAILGVVFLMISAAANAQVATVSLFEPGDVYFTSFAISGGAMVETRPMITLKDKTGCDMFSPVCMAKAERDFGPSVYDTLRKAIHQLAGIKE